ncbi:MAG: DMT family transporter [Betaproteobacteria bacterium]|nr:DMT family transporter [Betaproteobacteria bacterium]
MVTHRLGAIGHLPPEIRRSYLRPHAILASLNPRSLLLSTPMSAANLARLLLLAAIWGGSYAFLRVVAPVFGGIGTMWLRVCIAGLGLVTYAVVMREDLQLRQWWKQYAFIGLMNSALPFALIAFAMKTLPAGYGAILNALSPFFGALFAALMLAERLTAIRLFGMLLGMFGVGVIMNLGPIPLNGATLIAAAASITATVCYGFISVYTKKYTKGAPNIGIAAGALIFPSLLVAPFGVTAMPSTMPATPVIVALVLLALLCTSFANLLYFRLIRDAGPTKAISVTFLIPIFGVAWGAIFFGEKLNTGALVGGVIVMIGVALVLGLIAPAQKKTAA